MYSTFLGHFVLEKSIDHSVTGWLHLGLEGIGCDDQPKVSLLGSTALHGLVVRMEMGVVVDFKSLRIERRSHLCTDGILHGG